jgi:hypothetical protein
VLFMFDSLRPPAGLVHSLRHWGGVAYLKPATAATQRGEDRGGLAPQIRMEAHVLFSWPVWQDS